MHKSLIVIAALLLAACSSKPPVPKPEAWPRLQPYPEAYTAVDGFAVNDSARVSQPADGQLSAFYPRYGATLYVTFTPAADEARRQQVIDNRTERMALNTGGARSEVTELVSDGGYHCQLILTPAKTATPVQFLAVGKTQIVSGSAFLPDAAAAPTDSLAPFIHALYADILYALKHLR